MTFFNLPKTALLLLTGAALLTACQEEDPTDIEGPVPTAKFTVALNTSQFPIVATFTNTSADAFLYQWDFGDGSPLASGTTVTHTYRTSGTFKPKLVAAGKGGSNSVTQDLVIPSTCGNNGFAILTACAGSGATSWTISSEPGAVVRIAEDGTVISTSRSLTACEADDQFSFTSSFSYSYDAGEGTYVDGACGKALSGNSDFTYLPNANGLGSLTLKQNGAFLGTPDSVVNKTYEIIEATPTRLRLQGTNPDKSKTIVTYVPQLSALDRAKLLLTGGSSRTWVLESEVQGTITVGVEANPKLHYPGGPPNSMPPCQADDEYTFTSANVLNYNALAETFVAGSPGTCQAARTYSSGFTFGPATGTGIAQIELSKAGSFIGITDAPDLVYRIISITNERMVLRAGRGGRAADALVFEIKLRVK